MPTMPTKPKYDPNFDSHGYHMLNIAYYELCCHFDKESIEAVQRKFPNALTKLEVSLDLLPLDVTLQMVKKHLIDKVKEDDMTPTTYKDLL